MIRRLLKFIQLIPCRLGFHAWRIEEFWEPDYMAPIITRWESVATCRRCGLEDRVVHVYDEVTGEPLFSMEGDMTYYHK